jgi:hypothetical protein
MVETIERVLEYPYNTSPHISATDVVSKSEKEVFTFMCHAVSSPYRRSLVGLDYYSVGSIFYYKCHRSSSMFFLDTHKVVLSEKLI